MKKSALKNVTKSQDDVLFGQFTDLLYSFKKTNNELQIDKLVNILTEIQRFPDNEDEITRTEIMTVLGTVLA
jgi:hypothetical protein